ncbi:MAG: C40 family peptidase [Deltaproteobacteria bacterium]|nr:MAG: C40 family peptidase [Deltaproteobacteria bacterium]
MSLLSIIKTSVTAFIHPLLPVISPLLKESASPETPPSPLPNLVAQNPTLSQSLGWDSLIRNLTTPSQRILDAAHQAAGTRYQWGGESNKGMDCSHFVHHVYKQAGISYPYTTTHGDWQKAGFEKQIILKKETLFCGMDTWALL